MTKDEKARIVAWTLAMQDLQSQINDLKQNIATLHQRRLNLLGEDSVESIDIGNVNLETFKGEVEVVTNDNSD